MMTAIDAQAEALLSALIEQAGGDLLTAFSLLCSQVGLPDLAGEPFDRAIERAVGALYRRPAFVPAALLAGAEP